MEFITVGMDDEQRAAIGTLPKGHGILGLLIVDPRPIRLPDLGEHPDSFGFPPGHPPMKSFLGVPLFVRGEVYGNLYLTDKENEDGFSDIDEELALGLAAAASVVIDNARLNERAAELSLVADRERIGRDLHDTAIQCLFATGLAMQKTAATRGPSRDCRPAGRTHRRHRPHHPPHPHGDLRLPSVGPHGPR